MKTNLANKNIISLNSEDISAIDKLPKSELSAEDTSAQRNLKLIWSAYKKLNKITQSEFVTHKSLNFSQGNFSQYLTGKVPLGMRATLALSKALGCDPGDIREELRNKNLDKITKKLTEQLKISLSVLKDADGDYKYLTDEMERTLASPQLAVI